MTATPGWREALPSTPPRLGRAAAGVGRTGVGLEAAAWPATVAVGIIPGRGGACRPRPGKPGAPRYFLRRAPARFAALKEIPARIAFCWTAAAVRPSFLATCLVGVPALASALRVFIS